MIDQSNHPEPPAGKSKPDRLGGFITGPEFLGQANAAVTKAVDELKAKGIKPAFVVRERKD